MKYRLRILMLVITLGATPLCGCRSEVVDETEFLDDIDTMEIIDCSTEKKRLLTSDEIELVREFIRGGIRLDKAMEKNKPPRDGRLRHYDTTIDFQFLILTKTGKEIRIGLTSPNSYWVGKWRYLTTKEQYRKLVDSLNPAPKKFRKSSIKIGGNPIGPHGVLPGVSDSEPSSSP